MFLKSLHPTSIDYASREEIAVLQLSRLRTTVRHACERVPHPCKKFVDAGMHPIDLHD